MGVVDAAGGERLEEVYGEGCLREDDGCETNDQRDDRAAEDGGAESLECNELVYDGE